jgi:hypothetical protein
MERTIRKIGRIFTGFYLAITNRNNEISNSRMRICVPCRIRKGIRCGDCGCLLNLKTRVEDEECPKGYWKSLTTKVIKI